jgi:hypothetical protein
MEIMNICVLHLSDVERDTGSGVDREELIQWYLEQKETEFETEEDLEYERELIAKALTKLSRVSLILFEESPLDSTPSSFPLLPRFSFLHLHLLLFHLPTFLPSFWPGNVLLHSHEGAGGERKIDNKKGEIREQGEI